MKTQCVLSSVIGFGLMCVCVGVSSACVAGEVKIKEGSIVLPTYAPGGEICGDGP